MTHSYVRHDSFICATWLIHTCDMTHSYVRHDSFICLPSLIHMCDMTHSYVRHDSFICVPWLIHMFAMTHSYVWHDSGGSWMAQINVHIQGHLIVQISLHFRWGWIIFQRMRILSEIQFTMHFIESVVVETKRFVGSNETWSWRGKHAANARAGLREANAER